MGKNYNKIQITTKITTEITESHMRLNCHKTKRFAVSSSSIDPRCAHVFVCLFDSDLTLWFIAHFVFVVFHNNYTHLWTCCCFSHNIAKIKFIICIFSVHMEKSLCFDLYEISSYLSPTQRCTTTAWTTLSWRNFT